MIIKSDLSKQLYIYKWEDAQIVDGALAENLEWELSPNNVFTAVWCSLWTVLQSLQRSWIIFE